MPRAKQRTPELRERVLKAAVATLEEEGTAGFTTRKIAAKAGTSIPAVYELFGDRSGLLREVFFEGFRSLRRRFDELEDTADPRFDLVRLLEVFRSFVREHTMLADVMFSKPFTDFDPRPEELGAGSAVRSFIVAHVRRCIESGILKGDATDLSHVLLALAQGLAAQETAGWLGTSRASVDRRWETAIRVMLDGFGPSVADAAGERGTLPRSRPVRRR